MVAAKDKELYVLRDDLAEAQHALKSATVATTKALADKDEQAALFPADAQRALENANANHSCSRTLAWRR